ncbi:MAG: 16S rRNA (guanine(966)-N(2))-methyltransferase RsmD [Actinomycetes bacterium]
MAKGRLRVVAGTAGGLRLETPAGETVRPTTERVREAVFSSLGRAVVGVSVLDLFSGSGALAVEALSRGAAGAVCVERDATVAAVIGRNLAHTGFADRARVVVRSVAAFLGAVPPPEAPFGVVCCDPPYGAPTEEVVAVLAGLAAPGWCASSAVVLLERRSGEPLPTLPEGWEHRAERTYGDTLVHRLVASSLPET